MRLLSYLSLSLASLASWQTYYVSATQRPLNDTIEARRVTLIDALSADPEYTSLLVLLQRARLIPTLNKLNGSTLFAPTNDAISRTPLWHQALVSDDFLFRDNIHEKLRQELLYHLLNYTLPDEPLPDDAPQVHKTLHFPRKPLDLPSQEPPPGPPWMPIPGGTLGGEPQRLRAGARDGNSYIGVDAFGKDGAKVVKDRVNASNGIILGIGDVLDVPQDLATIVTSHPSLSYLSHIIQSTVLDTLNNTANVTLFLPVDDAWKKLPDIERKYLESEYALDDIQDIVQMHAVVEKKVFWADSFGNGVNLTSEYGSTIEVTPSSDKTTISRGELVIPDIYASNGVLHLVSSLLIPHGALKLTPEKYLLVLNCTSFVSLLHSVELTHLINSTDAKYTILAPNDDVLRLFGNALPEKGSDELKRLLSYHFIPGNYTPSKLKDGMLLGTALKDVGLDGGHQVLDVEVSENHLRFGGAGVIGDHLVIDNVTIYFISRHLVPPADVLETALPSLEFSSFLAAIFSTSLAEKLKTAPRSTFLIPTNDAFRRLGLLVSSHLLASTSKPDLENVILHHVLRDVEYSKSITNGSQQTFATLEGSDVHIYRRAANGSKISHPVVDPSGGWPGMQGEIKTRNMLTKTGVIHELQDVLIPRSVEVNVGKLVRAAKGDVMGTVVVRAGMEWVLNGTAPPENTEDGDRMIGMEGGWTFLCPTDDAFKAYNLTALYQDVDFMKALVRQHLIPTVQLPTTKSRLYDAPIEFERDASKRNRPLVLDDSATYKTLLSLFSESSYGDIAFVAVGPSTPGAIDPEYIVGIKDAHRTGARGDSARVLAWGRSTNSDSGGEGSSGGGVIQIDQVLMPYRPTWIQQYGAPIGVGIVGVMLIGAFFLGVRTVWRRDTTEATYEPVGGSEDD